MRKLTSLSFRGLFVAVTLWSIGTTRAQPTDAGSAAVPPAATENQATVESTTRQTIRLDGAWRFMPATADAPADEQWGSVRVPGSWSKPEDLLSRGTGGAWDGVDLTQLGAAWYETTITIPADWKDRRIALDVARVSTDAAVYLDGQPVGEVAWPEGTIDLTDRVRAGASHQLRVRVVAANNRERVLVLMGTAPGQNYEEKAELDARGLIGRVALRAMPRGARIESVFIKPSVREKQLTVETELTAVATGGPVTVTAEIVDEQGQVEKRFTSRAEVTPGQSSLVTTWDWANPRLWDVWQPNLYTLRLRLNGAGIDDAVSERFGFREFWIDGRQYMLNGVPFRARTALIGGINQAPDEAKVASLRKRGFNLGELWPHDTEQRGKPDHGRNTYDLADRLGFPVTGLSPHMDWMGNAINTPEKLARYTDAVRRAMRRDRNHPSIVMWGTSGNMFGGDQDPAVLGQREPSRQARLRRSPHMRDPIAIADRGLAVFRQLDPTRPVFIHHGGDSGDVYTLNYYLNFTPLQEREEWLSTYVAKGEMPLWFVEFGTPVGLSLLRGRNGFHNAMTTEPFLSEYVAAHLGREAYALEPAGYRTLIAGKFLADQKYDLWWAFEKQMLYSPAWLKMQTDFVANTWRSWRTWGMTGGMIPWDNAYSELNGEETVAGRALRMNNQPTLAWITGPAGAFTDKTHSYPAGGRIAKQIAVVNDDRTTQTYQLTARVMLGGREIAKVTHTGKVEPAQTRFVPVNATVPARLDGDKVDGEVTLEATIGDAKHTDQFAFRAFGQAPPAAQRKVLAFDPAGTTSRMLVDQFNVTVDAWDGKPSSVPLVIGREALEAGKALPGDLAAFVNGGGGVLVMAQRPEVLTDGLGLRVSPLQSRRVFRVPGEHPVTAGLDDADLRNWAGTGTLLEPYPDYIHDERYNTMSPANTPTYGWRWGNRHTVASTAIEKPHRAGWTPILECEFDLAYTPLMELNHGAGRVVWCQLDLEDQAGVDPAARKLTGQLLDYVATAPTAKRETVTYLGGDEKRQLLDQLGLSYVPAAGGSMPASGLLVVDPDGDIDPAAVERFAAAGNRVLVLASRGTASFAGATYGDGTLGPVADAPEPGLSVSDLRSRSDVPWRIIQRIEGGDATAGGLVGSRKVGRGMISYAQLDPDRLDADVKTYHRLTRWRQTRALVQVLANLGASFEQDKALLATPQQKVAEPRIALAGQWQAKLLQKLPAAPSSEQGHPDPGISDAARRALEEPKATLAGAENVSVPGPLETFGKDWKDADGEAIFRRSFDVPEALGGQDLLLSLGSVDDFDETYVNGRRVGGVDASDPSAWSVKREYAVPADLLKPKGNVVVVRVWDRFGGGGFTAGQRALLHLRKADAASGEPQRGFYHPDYRADWEMGDDPHRYFNW